LRHREKILKLFSLAFLQKNRLASALLGKFLELALTARAT
jgi:hypothetical protein